MHKIIVYLPIVIETTETTHEAQVKHAMHAFASAVEELGVDQLYESDIEVTSVDQDQDYTEFDSISTDTLQAICDENSCEYEPSEDDMVLRGRLIDSIRDNSLESVVLRHY